MKKLRITLCAIFVLFSGFVFAACSEEDKNFEVGKIEVVQDEFVYDGNAHAITFRYPEANLDVQYALESDKENFMSLSELGLVDAGTYSVYYQLSANGFNTFTSEQTIEFTIKPIDITVNINDLYVLKSDGVEETISPNWSRSEGTVLPNESMNLSFSIGNNSVGDVEFNANNVNVGDVYHINAVAANPNYNVTYQGGYVYVIDYIQLNNGATTSYYSNLNDAVAHATSGAEIVLHKNVEVDSTIQIDKSITINGQGVYSIKASENFADGNVVLVNNTGSTVNLKNVTVDGNEKARVVKVNAGKLIVDNATITNGYGFVGGVFVTESSQFEMVSGRITGNKCSIPVEEREYQHIYSTDLWIGSQAQGSLVSISGGEVGNVFVNANEYSSQNASFKLDGGIISKVYVEYDKGFGATFNYVSGTVNELLISTKGVGEFVKEELVENTIYKGGVVAVKRSEAGVKTSYYDEALVEKEAGDVVTAFVYSKETLLTAYEYADEIIVVANIGDNTQYVGDITLKATSKNYNFVIDLNGKTIAAELDFINFVSKDVYTEYGITVSIVDNSSNDYEAKTGTIGCELSDYGVLVKGNDKVSVTLDGVKLQGNDGGIYSNGFCVGSTIKATNCDFKGFDSVEGVGAYLAGNYSYEFVNCNFVGATGYYAKSGNHRLTDCSFNGTLSEYAEENFNGNGADPTGSAVVVDSATGYQVPMSVVLTNCSFQSVAGYCIEEFATSDSVETCYSTVVVENAEYVSCGKDYKVYSENNVITGVDAEDLEIAG